MSFNGTTDYFLGPVVTTITNRFGIEAWVNPASVDSGIIAANGHTGVSGYGLLVFDGTYYGIFGGVDVFYGGPATPGVWTQLTLTDNDGVVEMYQNGVLESTNFAFPQPIPNPNFPSAPVYLQIGGDVNGGELFTGLIDQVSVYSTPEPSSYLLMGLGLLGMARAIKRRR